VIEGKLALSSELLAGHRLNPKRASTGPGLAACSDQPQPCEDQAKLPVDPQEVSV
jgi:hypothetical protein